MNVNNVNTYASSSKGRFSILLITGLFFLNTIMTLVIKTNIKVSSAKMAIQLKLPSKIYFAIKFCFIGEYYFDTSFTLISVPNL